ncbi:MAG: light-regulated signal transduction histidine kinase (bacteriophytochrome) [Halopseudomonas sp.]|jgi:chemotaxis family two-component system sensor kinase Cph1|uniref:GAF domain-containing sensor histidine kinase n=1 Tax=Halopseudomonas sp. TaxID=2901191 RepID=UPI0039E21FBA
MTSSTSTEASSVDNSAHPDNAMHSRSELVLAVNEADNLLDALSNSQLDLAGLVTCDASAVIVNQAVVSLRGDCESLALEILNTLHKADDSGVFHSNHVQTKISSGAGVLAIRFCPPEDGWLLWFRKDQQHWIESDIGIAATLRADLLAACLQRATMASRVQQKLISTLAHDLCNPLQSITMSAALLKPQSQRDTDLSRHIIAAGKRLERLIGQVRDLNELQSGKRISVNPVPTDLSALVNSVLKDEQTLYPELILKTDIEPSIKALVDAQRYAEVIAHLLGNASQQSKPGTATTLHLHTNDENSHLTITSEVEPVTAEQMAGLFRPSAGDGRLLDQSSLGMGLYICGAIVQAHNGSVSAEQAEGSITFCLSLPLIAP